jgi:hypothetical protein
MTWKKEYKEDYIYNENYNENSEKNEKIFKKSENENETLLSSTSALSSSYNKFVNMHKYLKKNASQTAFFGFRADPPTVTSQRLKGDIFVHTCMYVYVYVDMFVYIYRYIDICICIDKHIQIDICIYVCIYIFTFLDFLPIHLLSLLNC